MSIITSTVIASLAAVQASLYDKTCTVSRKPAANTSSDDYLYGGAGRTGALVTVYSGVPCRVSEVGGLLSTVGQQQKEDAQTVITMAGSIPLQAGDYITVDSKVYLAEPPEDGQSFKIATRARITPIDIKDLK